MKLDTVKRDVQSSGNLRSAAATIKASPKIFSMFEDGTYANKPLAIMRELVANGIDAHMAAGRPDRPVEVVLPTPLDPTCRIRDYGIGMSQLFILGDESTPSKFMAYTDGSTKDGNDDAIGGFGIGSKSPFSYVDQYNLRVVHDGVLSVYTMFKNTDGIPEVALQAETTTDEPNGVEVSFPVEDEDMASFAEAAQQALQYFRPLPLVTNGTVNPPEYTYEGRGWSMRKAGGPLGVIMGGVRYPAVTASFDYTLRNDPRVGKLLDYGLDLTMPIGACAIAMSREQLSYVTKTNDSIRAALESMVDDIVATFSTIFDTAPSEWEAMKMLYDETDTSSYNKTARQQIMMTNAKYKGKPLTTDFRLPDFVPNTTPPKPYGIKTWAIEEKARRRSINCPNPKWQGLADLYGIQPGSIKQLIIDDLPESPKSKAVQKIKEYVDTNPVTGKVLVFRGNAKLILQLLRGPQTYVLTSTMPEPSPKVKTANGAVRPKVRMFTYNGGSDGWTGRPFTNLTPSASKSKAVFEIAYADQPATGILVAMNSFDLPKDFHKRMETGVMKYDELYFVNGTDVDKVKANFEDFETVFQDRLKKALAAQVDLPQRLAVLFDVTMRKHGDTFQTLNGHGLTYASLTPSQQARPFGRLYGAWDKYVRTITPDQRQLAAFVTAALPVGLRPKSLEEAMNAKQGDVVILIEELRLHNRKHAALLVKNL